MHNSNANREIREHTNIFRGNHTRQADAGELQPNPPPFREWLAAVETELTVGENRECHTQDQRSSDDDKIHAITEKLRVFIVKNMMGTTNVPWIAENARNAK